MTPAEMRADLLLLETILAKYLHGDHSMESIGVRTLYKIFTDALGDAVKVFKSLCEFLEHKAVNE